VIWCLSIILSHLLLLPRLCYPRRYFTDRDDGSFNTFDFTIVVAGFAFIGNENGSALGGLRMLRLVRP